MGGGGQVNTRPTSGAPRTVPARCASVRVPLDRGRRRRRGAEGGQARVGVRAGGRRPPGRPYAAGSRPGGASPRSGRPPPTQRGAGRPAGPGRRRPGRARRPATADLTAAPVPVRVGEATTLDGGFPVLLPLGGGAHLAIDGDARDPRVGELLRARGRCGCSPPPRPARSGSPAIDPAALRAPPSCRCGRCSTPGCSPRRPPPRPRWPPCSTQAEPHARAAQHAGPAGRELLLVVAASAPPARELARLAALTHAGPAAAVCVLLAGYPPGRPGRRRRRRWARTTQLRLNERYALRRRPARRSRSAPTAPGWPPRSCSTATRRPDRSRALAARLGRRHPPRRRRSRFTDLLPDRRWAESGRRRAADGASAAPGGTPVTVAFDDATPHWLVGGRTGAGKTVFLLDVLYGLAARYSPAELAALPARLQGGRAASPSSSRPSATRPGCRTPARSASSPTGSTAWPCCASCARR